MKALDDITLVTRVAVLADKRAFDQLVGRYQSAVRRFFLHQTLGDRQLTDDLAQDTFVKAYANITRFHGLSNFSTWLYRIAYNVFYDYARSHRQTEDMDKAATAPATGAHGNADCALRMDMRNALATLKPEERTCITLQLIEGQTIERIAEIMRMPAGTVKSHLSRGKEKLTKYLRNNGYDRR